MEYPDITLNHINDSPLADFTLPLVAICKHPLDFPNKYVGRIWNVNHPSRFLIIADTYEELLAKKPHWMVILPRDKDDDPCIMESWI